VPANGLAARSELNLVTAVESVETVRAAGRSAGGVPTEQPARVLEFAADRLRHRDRAVTPRDFEALVRQRSADVAQARCFVRAGRVRLVVVMRGANPLPSAAEKREFRRMLLERAAPTLAFADALVVEAPAILWLRVDLVLEVATLDDVGAVTLAAKERIAAFFDTEFGGEARDGWPLGENPREEDIAQALLDIDRLLGIGRIDLVRVVDGKAESWPDRIGADRLVRLDPEIARATPRQAETIA